MRYTIEGFSQISIHALRGEGDDKLCDYITIPYMISIHALRGEGDYRSLSRPCCQKLDFNPRPPWGGRLYALGAWLARQTFQSTPSVGRATWSVARSVSSTSHFNPRPPWGGRRYTFERIPRVRLFQSTPSVGRATSLHTGRITASLFQSTPSVGRATSDATSARYHRWTFQSTPSVGRATRSSDSLRTRASHFNPRPPWGGRLTRKQ